MSLREHQIQSAIVAFDVEQDDQVIGRISKASQMPMPVAKTMNSNDESMFPLEQFGFGMVRTGVAILSVPDLLPIVDEAVGIGLVAGGAALIYSQQR